MALILERGGERPHPREVASTNMQDQSLVDSCQTQNHVLIFRKFDLASKPACPKCTLQRKETGLTQTREDEVKQHLT